MAAQRFGETVVYHGDCINVMQQLVSLGTLVDSVVCDPPYHLSTVKRFATGAPAQYGTDGLYQRASKGFMGKEWDGGDVAFNPETWRRCYDLLKPGGYLLAFSGSRTYHRMACAIEDAGFEIRDQLMWLYGTGFPKSHDVSKAIDKAAGAEREKVRVPAAQVRNPKATGAGRDGTEGATRPWIEAALRVGYHEKSGDTPATDAAQQWEGWGTALKPSHEPIVMARKPLIGTVAENVLTHGTGAINIDACRVGIGDNDRAEMTGRSGSSPSAIWGNAPHSGWEPAAGRFPANVIHDGSLTETWARYFYAAKASKADRAGSKHPTVKPVSLIEYLCKLVTRPGGVVLDPFAGSGTLAAAWPRSILIEREAEYYEDILRRLTCAE